MTAQTENMGGMQFSIGMDNEPFADAVAEAEAMMRTMAAHSQTVMQAYEKVSASIEQSIQQGRNNIKAAMAEIENDYRGLSRVAREQAGIIENAGKIEPPTDEKADATPDVKKNTSAMIDYAAVLKGVKISMDAVNAAVSLMKSAFSAAYSVISSAAKMIATTVSKAFDVVRDSVRFVGESLEKLGSKMRTWGIMAGVAITAPLTLASRKWVSQFSDFDDAMTQSTAIMLDLTADQRKAMEETARSIAKTGLVSSTELAKSYYYLASAGLSAEQSILSLGAVNNFATAGMFDMSTATSLLAGAQGALGKKSADAETNLKNMIQISDALVKANVLANGSVKEFAEAIANDAGAMMKNFNVEMEQGVAILAAFADQGTKGAAAGTSFARLLSYTIRAVNEHADVFEKYGITTKNAQTGNLELVQTLEDMTRAFSTLGATAKSAALTELGFEVEAQKGILPLLGTTEAIKRYYKELKNASGYTDKVAANQLMSFASQMKMFGNRVEIVGQKIGEKLAPYVLKMTDYIDRGLVYWEKLSNEMQDAAIQAGMFAAGLAPVLGIVGTATAILGGFVTTLAGIISPMGLAVASAGVLGAAWFTMSTDGAGALDSMQKSLSTFADTAIDYAKKVYKEWAEVFADATKLFEIGEYEKAMELLWATVRVAAIEGALAVTPIFDELFNSFASGGNTVVEWGKTVVRTMLVAGRVIRETYLDIKEFGEDVLDSSMSLAERMTKTRDMFMQNIKNDVANMWGKTPIGKMLGKTPIGKMLGMGGKDSVNPFADLAKQLGVEDPTKTKTNTLWGAWKFAGEEMESTHKGEAEKKRRERMLGREDKYSDLLKEFDQMSGMGKDTTTFGTTSRLTAELQGIMAGESKRLQDAQIAAAGALYAAAMETEMAEEMKYMAAMETAELASTAADALAETMPGANMTAAEYDAQQAALATPTESPIDTVGKFAVGGGFLASALMGQQAGSLEKVNKDQLQVQKDILQEMRMGRNTETSDTGGYLVLQ